MDLCRSFQTMALYNQRMNTKLIQVCHKLSEQQLNQSTGAFFPSILDHWNHILFGDLIMLQRLVKNDFFSLEAKDSEELPVAMSVNDKFVSNLEELFTLRQKVDSLYISFTQSLIQEALSNNVVYLTTEGEKIERNLAEFCMHVFNHQTHHRGQITCLLSQFGKEYGSTDLPIVVPKLENA